MSVLLQAMAPFLRLAVSDHSILQGGNNELGLTDFMLD